MKEKYSEKKPIYVAVIKSFDKDLTVCLVNGNLTQNFQSSLLKEEGLFNPGDVFLWYTNDDGMVQKGTIQPVYQNTGHIPYEEPSKLGLKKLELIVDYKGIEN